MKLRRGICYVLVGCCSFVQMQGCLPFLPGAFGMMCLENGKKGWLLLCALLGLASAVPWLEAVRYMITILVILIGSAVLETIYGRKDSMHMAIWTFCSVFIVGIGGVFMDSNLSGVISVALEGLLGFGLVLTFNRFVHWFLTPKEKIFVTRPILAEERDNRVRRYVSACEKLAQVFAVPQYEYVSGAAPGGESTKSVASLADHLFMQSRAAISQQLLTIAGNIERCTKEEICVCKEDRQLLRRLEYELKENGIIGREFTIYEDADGRHRLEFVAHTVLGQNLSLRNLAELISRILAISMVPQEDMKIFLNRDERRVRFVESGRFQVLAGHKKRAGDGERVCGDNEFFLSLNDGSRKILGISDGMGRGPTAAKESELVVEVTEELLEAGFMPEQAVLMVNSACAMRNEEHGCPTLDLCCVDTFTGVGSWYKMGAAASFLRRGTQVEILYGTTLPIGAVEQPMVWKQERQLQDGDTLIFMTDGALELLPSEHPEEMMKELIMHLGEDTPGDMADKLMEILTQLSGQSIRDDVLISVLRVWER